MYKYLYLITVLLALSACKKDNKPTAPASVDATIVGTWKLNALSTNYGSPVNVTAAQYPCLVNNVATYNEDHTETVRYTGLDICFVTPTHNSGLGTSVGAPNQPVTNETWSSKGNNVYEYYAGKTHYGILSNQNGQLHLISRDTLISGKDTSTFMFDYVKQ